MTRMDKGSADGTSSFRRHLRGGVGEVAEGLYFSFSEGKTHMKLLLVDDHAILRDGLRAILAPIPGFEIVGEAGNGRDGIELAARLRPDVVIMDVSMPDLGGIDATRLMLAANPRLRVIALSMHSDRRYVTTMLAAGAAGFVMKDSAASELIEAIETVGRGSTYVSDALVAGLEPIGGNANGTVNGNGHGLRVRKLSSRERQVLQLVAEGRSSKEIASRLTIAVPTVETHRRQIMGKLGLRSVAELTKYAVREGLTALER